LSRINTLAYFASSKVKKILLDWHLDLEKVGFHVAHAARAFVGAEHAVQVNLIKTFFHQI